MGVLKQGILGGVKGKVGSVVGSSWKGIATLRALPLSVANPRTAAQVGNRERFSSVVALATVLLSAVIKPLNDRFASGMSGYNLFVQRCKGAFLANGTFVPAELIVSRGKLGATPITSVIADEGDAVVTINFSASLANGYQSLTDMLYAFVLDSDGNLLGIDMGGGDRAGGSAEVTTSRILVEGETIHCYLSFLRADGTMCADSTYSTVQVATV